MPVRYGFHRAGDDDDDVDAGEILDLLADDYLESGDLEAAMENLLRQGYTTADGERVEGLAGLAARARRRRVELESQAGAEDELDRYREWLAEIEETEVRAIDDLLERAEASGDERRVEVTRHLADERALERNLMSERFAERLSSYQHYDFVSSEARESFEEMLGELERDVLSTYFEQAKDFMGRADEA